VELVVGDAVVVAIPRVLDVPASRVELDETHALLDEPPCDEAFAPEVTGLEKGSAS
jgi:hypothetical protein